MFVMCFSSCDILLFSKHGNKIICLIKMQTSYICSETNASTVLRYDVVSRNTAPAPKIGIFRVPKEDLFLLHSQLMPVM